MDVKEAIDIEDIIEEKYNDWLYSTNEGIGLTIEEAKHILRNDPNFHYCDSLLYEAYKVVLSELKKKEAIIDEMAKYMAGGNSYMYGTPEGIKEDFTKKCEGK